MSFQNDILDIKCFERQVHLQETPTQQHYKYLQTETNATIAIIYLQCPVDIDTFILGDVNVEVINRIRQVQNTRRTHQLQFAVATTIYTLRSKKAANYKQDMKQPHNNILNK